MTYPKSKKKGRMKRVSIVLGHSVRREIIIVRTCCEIQGVLEDKPVMITK